MAILIDENMSVIVQGITGREGMARTELMMEYGTNVLAGCTPGKGGQKVLGLPVYDTLLEATEKHGVFDVSVVYVPARLVKNAALEAIEAGVKLIILVPDRVPVWDVMEIARSAEINGAQFIGPNTLGVLSVDKAVLGMIGGNAKSAREWFKKGNVGVASRSGGITSSIGYYLCQSGIGLSTLVHVGGDPIVGLPHPSVMELFEKDSETDAVVMFGEIGTSQEEQVADLIESKKFTKPLVAYIGGKAATSGTRFSHAGAIVEGNSGTHAGKVKRLKEVGVTVVDEFGDLPEATNKVLKTLT